MEAAASSRSSEASYLCPLCKKRFDLIKKIPIAHYSCCFDTTCKQCWTSLFKNGQFVCHNGCESSLCSEIQP